MDVMNEWTVAYRLPDESVFHRVLPLHLTWKAATEVTRLMHKAMPLAEVWYVTTALHDATNVTEDSFNIIVIDEKGEIRVPVIEDGVLPESVRNQIQRMS